MANVSFFSSSWVGTEDNDLYPGESQDWIMWGFSNGDAISVSAHPISGPGERILAVENVRVQSQDDTRRLFITVRNVGNVAVSAYSIGFSYISE